MQAVQNQMVPNQLLLEGTTPGLLANEAVGAANLDASRSTSLLPSSTVAGATSTANMRCILVPTYGGVGGGGGSYGGDSAGRGTLGAPSSMSSMLQMMQNVMNQMFQVLNNFLGSGTQIPGDTQGSTGSGTTTTTIPTQGTGSATSTTSAGTTTGTVTPNPSTPLPTPDSQKPVTKGDLDGFLTKLLQAMRPQQSGNPAVEKSSLEKAQEGISAFRKVIGETLKTVTDGKKLTTAITALLKRFAKGFGTEALSGYAPGIFSKITKLFKDDGGSIVSTIKKALNL